MSVSEGIKKYGTKNYYIKLISLETEEQIQEGKKGVKVQPWTKVSQLKLKVAKYYGVSIKNIRLFFCNIEMLDELTMLDYQVIDSKKPEVYYRIYSFSAESDKYIGLYAAFPCNSNQRRLIEDIRHGLLQNLAPTLILEGTSGTYMMRNTNKDVVALFKPIDEEAFAPNNQKGYNGKFGQESFRKGILSGEGSIREVAAFLLDKNNFFFVPETTFVEVSHPVFNKNANELLSIDNNTFTKVRNSIIHNFVLENLVSSGIVKNNTCLEYYKNHEKIIQQDKKNLKINTGSDLEEIHSLTHSSIKKKYGSLQKFIKSNDVAANFSYTLFDSSEIHKIGVLDIRILNCDRNDENILVKKKKDTSSGKTLYRLIPIDHSLSFPDCIKIQEYEMCWMGWEQACVPFNKEMLSYIKKIDIMADMNRISGIIKLRDKCWRNFRISNMVLKIGAEMGLNLYQIGMMLYKPGFDEEVLSDIEHLIEKTEKICCLYSKISIETLTNLFFSTNHEEEQRPLSSLSSLSSSNQKKHFSVISPKEFNNFPSNCTFIEDREETYVKKLENYKSTDTILVQQTNYATSGISNDETEKLSDPLDVGTQEILDVKEDQSDEEVNKQNQIEINQLNDEDYPKKKKNSLLKRTTSEPELSKLDSTQDFKYAEDPIIDKNEYINLKFKEKRRSIVKKQLCFKSEEERSRINRELNFDSPFNEMFFYNFENILIEFINKKRITPMNYANY